MKAAPMMDRMRLRPLDQQAEPARRADVEVRKQADEELHRLEREPILAARYVNAAAGAILNYTVSWFDDAGGDDHAVKCWVTAGSCNVGAINQADNAVNVSWTMPTTAGDHEIVIAVGNGHYFGTTKDRVSAR